MSHQFLDPDYIEAPDRCRAEGVSQIMEASGPDMTGLLSTLESLGELGTIEHAAVVPAEHEIIASPPTLP